MVGTHFKPPKLKSSELGSENRHATWTELFYDLAFVVAIAVLAYGFGENPTRNGLFNFIILLMPIWLLWFASTLYADRFDSDDVGHRVAILIQMVGIVGLAVFAIDGLGKSFVGFVISYLIVQGAILFNNLRAGIYNPSVRPLTTRYAIGYIIGAIFWIAAILSEPPLRYYLAGTGLLIDFLIPFITSKHARTVKINVSHLAERFGLFTIIILGEVIVSVVVGVSETNVGISALASGLLGMTIVFCVWWIYFGDLEPESLPRRTFFGKHALGKTLFWSWLKSTVIIYAHLPLTVSLVIVGVGLETAIITQSEVLPSATMWLIGGGIAVSFFCITTIKLAMMRGQPLIYLAIEAATGYAAAFAAFAIAYFGLINNTYTFLGAMVGLSLPQMFITFFAKRST